MGLNPPSQKADLENYSGQPVSPSYRLYKGTDINLPQQNGLQQLAGILDNSANKAGQIQEQTNQLDYQKQQLAYEQQQKLDTLDSTNATAQYHMGVNEAWGAYQKNFPENGDVATFYSGWKDAVKGVYDGVYGDLKNNNAKQMFIDQSDPITLGAFSLGDHGQYELGDARITAKSVQGLANMTQAAINDPQLLKSPELVYGKGALQMPGLVAGMSTPQAKIAAITKMQGELSAAIFTAMGQSDLVTGAGAQRALDMIHSGHTLGLPGGEPMQRMVDHLQTIVSTAQTRQAETTYMQMKDASQDMIGNLINKRVSTTDMAAAQNSLQKGILDNKYSTPEQQQWATHELASWKIAQQLGNLGIDPANTVAFNAVIQKLSSNSPVGGGGDPVAKAANIQALRDMQKLYKEQYDTGKNYNGQDRTSQEMSAIGDPVELQKPQISQWTTAFQTANADKAGNQADNLIAVADQMKATYANDPRLLAVGMRQLAKNPETHLNEQTILALQIPGTHLLRNTAVTAATSTYQQLTAAWSKTSNDSAGVALEPSKFKTAVYNSPGYVSIMNNPSLGRFPQEVGELQELTLKIAATYVNNGMSQAAAATQAEKDVLHGSAVGNLWVDNSYSADAIKSKKDQTVSNVDIKADVSNPWRSGVMGYNQVRTPQIPVLSGASAQFIQQYGAFADAQAAKYHVPPQLLRNLLTKESGWNPAATSARNSNGTVDHGIAQINDSSLKPGLDPYNAQQAITYAASRLGDAIQHYHGNLHNAVASYNAGIGAIDKNGAPLPGPNTDYVNKIVGPSSFASNILPLLTPQQRLIGEQQLAAFKRAPIILTDDKAPGHSMIGMYMQNGRQHPLVDPAGNILRIPLKSLASYNFKTPYARDWMPNATGGF